ncbi:MAG TPA: hypothetical protein VM406_01850 [Noviherbaspirillum sp.]|nr:hypothetical protein [Noviherbaspirillum sp.]
MRFTQAFKAIPPVALATLCMLAASAAQAGRPMITDDAAILEANACQLETWYQATRSAGNEWWALPACNVGGYAEVAIGGARLREPDGRTTVAVIQAKALLRAYDETRPGFGMVLGTERDRGVHRGSAGNPFIAGIASVPLRGEAMLLHANLGWQRVRDDFAGTRENSATWALALDSEVAARTRVSLESYGQSRERAMAQFGVAYDLAPGRVQIDGSVGSRIARGAPDRYATIGLVFFTDPLFR